MDTNRVDTYVENSKDEIYFDLFDIIEIIRKKAIHIIISGLGLTLLCTGIYYFFIEKPRKIETVIQLNFRGIEAGQNPDGSIFNAQAQILARQVIDDALATTGLGDKISALALQDSITVQAIVPTDAAKAVEQSIKEGKGSRYFPSSFVLAYSMSSRSDLDSNQVRRLLDAIVSSYRIAFVRNFSEQEVLANSIQFIDIEKADYSEMIEQLTMQFKTLIDFVSNKLSDPNDNKDTAAKTFRSSATGLSFSDIEKYLSGAFASNKNTLDAMQKFYNLTKNKNYLIDKYEYLISQNEMELAKKDQEALASKDMMNSYKQGLVTMNLGGDDRSKIIQNFEDKYYGTLAERSLVAKIKAINLRQDNASYRAILQHVRTGNVSDAARDEAEKRFLILFKAAQENLGLWIEKTNRTLEDYYSLKYKNAVVAASPASISAQVSQQIVIGASLLVGGMLSFISILAVEIWRKSRSNQRSISRASLLGSSGQSQVL